MTNARPSRVAELPDEEDLPWFVVEEVNSSFFSQSRQSMGITKTKPHKVHLGRWQHVRMVHIILAFPGIQSYFAHHLRCPHNHLTKEEKVAWMNSQYSFGVPIKQYNSEDGVHESSFLRIGNHPVSSSLFKAINWESIVTAALEHGKKRHPPWKLPC